MLGVVYIPAYRKVASAGVGVMGSRIDDSWHDLYSVIKRV